MKSIVIFILALCLCVGVVSAQENIEKSFDVKEGEYLEIDIETGSDIVIESWNKKEVYVKVSMRSRDWEDYDIEIEKKTRGVFVKVEEAYRYYRGRRSRNNQMRVVVKVPEKFDLDLNTMGGDISIKDIEGDFRGKTMGGDLDLKGLKGFARLTTMGGDVDIRDSELDGSVSTMGGEVLVQDVTGDLDASSMGGMVIQKNVTDARGKTTGNEVRMKTMGGRIQVDDAPNGADLHTMGGNIRVRSAKDHVKATTMGGDIEIRELDGWIEAITYGGDIEVTITGDPNADNKDIELESLSGDVDLYLPDKFSMDVFVEIEYTRNSRGRYRIESDFDLSVEETKEWEYSRRSGHDSGSRWDRRHQYKYITGEASQNGGKNKVTVRTVNGSVRIKKR